MASISMAEVEHIAEKEDTPWRFMTVNRNDGGKAVYIVPKEIPINTNTTGKLSGALLRRLSTLAISLMILLPLYFLGVISLITMAMIIGALGVLSFVSGSVNIPFFSGFFHDNKPKYAVNTIDYPLVKFNLTNFGKDKFKATNTYPALDGPGITGAVNRMKELYDKNLTFLFRDNYSILMDGSEVIVDKDAFKKYKNAIEDAKNAIAAEAEKKHTLQFSFKGSKKDSTVKQINAPKASKGNPFLEVYPKPVEEIEYLRDNHTHTFQSSNFKNILTIAEHYDDLNQKQLSDYGVCVRELVSAYKFNKITLDASDVKMQHDLYMKIYHKVDAIMADILDDLSRRNVDNLALIDGFLNEKYSQEHRNDYDSILLNK